MATQYPRRAPEVDLALGLARRLAAGPGAVGLAPLRARAPAAAVTQPGFHELAGVVGEATRAAMTTLAGVLAPAPVRARRPVPSPSPAKLALQTSRE